MQSDADFPPSLHHSHMHVMTTSPNMDENSSHQDDDN